MVRQIAPVFLTVDIPATLAYYTDKLGFECLGTWQNPPVYAIVARDQHAVHFRCAAPPIPNPDKYGDELPLISTEHTARDLDALRASVGEAQLTYLGYSYGTLLGAVYAQLFPKNVRALVLDGAVDPTLSAQAAAEKQAGGFELAFKNFTAWCSNTPTSRPSTCRLQPFGSKVPTSR